MGEDVLKSNLVKMFNVNREHVNQEISRLGSIVQRKTTYRRNGMLNFGGRQMMAINGLNFHMVGVGGPLVVGT